MNSAFITMGFIVVMILFLQWLMPRLIDREVPFGVRIPRDRVNDLSVQKAYRTYYFGMVITTIIVLVSWFFSFSVSPGSSSQAIFALLPLLPLMLGFITYYTVRRILMHAKRAGHWMEGHRQVIAVETNMEKYREKVSFSWALPALLIVFATLLIGAIHFPYIPNVFPIHYDINGVPNRFATKSVLTVFMPVLLQIGLILLMSFLQVVTLRTRDSLDPVDPAGSAKRQSHRNARLIRAIWIMMTCINLSMLFTSLATWGVIHAAESSILFGVFALNMIGIVVIIIAAVKSPVTSLSIHEGANSAVPVRRDDDANWILGVFYFNRNDPRLLVGKRFGIGWTINFAHPFSWGIIVALVLVIVLGTVFPVIRRG